MSILFSFLKNERGQTFVEYGLILLLVSTAVIGAVIGFSDVLVDLYQEVIVGLP